MESTPRQKARAFIETMRYDSARSYANRLLGFYEGRIRDCPIAPYGVSQKLAERIEVALAVAFGRKVTVSGKEIEGVWSLHD